MQREITEKRQELAAKEESLRFVESSFYNLTFLLNHRHNQELGKPTRCSRFSCGLLKVVASLSAGYSMEGSQFYSTIFCGLFSPWIMIIRIPLFRFHVYSQILQAQRGEVSCFILFASHHRSEGSRISANNPAHKVVGEKKLAMLVLDLAIAKKKFVVFCITYAGRDGGQHMYQPPSFASLQRLLRIDTSEVVHGFDLRTQSIRWHVRRGVTHHEGVFTSV